MQHVMQSFAQVTMIRHIWSTLRPELLRKTPGCFTVVKGRETRHVQSFASEARHVSHFENSEMGNNSVRSAVRQWRQPPQGRAHHVEANRVRYGSRGCDDYPTAGRNGDYGCGRPQSGCDVDNDQSWSSLHRPLFSRLRGREAHPGKLARCLRRPHRQSQCPRRHRWSKGRGVLLASEPGQRNSGRGLGLHELDGGRLHFRRPLALRAELLSRESRHADDQCHNRRLHHGAERSQFHADGSCHGIRPAPARGVQQDGRLQGEEGWRRWWRDGRSESGHRRHRHVEEVARERRPVRGQFGTRWRSIGDHRPGPGHHQSLSEFRGE